MPLPLEQNGLGRSDLLRHNSHIATGVPQNPIVDSEDVYGGMKPPVDTVATANGLFGDLAAAGGGTVVGGETNTLRPYSSIVYVTGESKFYVLTGTAGYVTTDWEWVPLSDHIGGALKLQNQVPLTLLRTTLRQTPLMLMPLELVLTTRVGLLWSMLTK